MSEKDKIRTQKSQENYLMDDESSNMDRKPIIENDNYKAAGKLEGKVAVITGGDSGIGAAIAILFAKEGADIAFTYYEADDDAERTKKRLEEIGARVVVEKGDVGDEVAVKKSMERIVDELGPIDILVNHAGEQHQQESVTGISAEQLDRTFRTNVFGIIYSIKAAMPHLKDGASIINTTSVTAYKGNDAMMDYAGSNGAITSFTRSLAQNQEIADKKIRVNMVAPGPIWTPLIPATYPEEKLKNWGEDGVLKRPGEAYEVAPAYVYLASDDSSYVTGQCIHVNGGIILNT